MFLRACVIDRRNILVSGGTGTGKTTMLNVLSSFIPFKERIITIEDTTELRLHQEHVVTLETKPPNVEGAGEYTIRDLVQERPAHAARPDHRGRMPRGRGPGHDPGHEHRPRRLDDHRPRQQRPRGDRAPGSAGADGRRLAGRLDPPPDRLGPGPDRAHQPAARRGRAWSRQISEVVRYDPEEKQIIVIDIFNFRDGVSLRPTGYLPSFIDSLMAKDLLDLEFLYGREADGRRPQVDDKMPTAMPEHRGRMWLASLVMGAGGGRGGLGAAATTSPGPWRSSSATWPTSSAACGAPTRNLRNYLLAWLIAIALHLRRPSGSAAGQPAAWP